MVNDSQTFTVMLVSRKTIFLLVCDFWVFLCVEKKKSSSKNYFLSPLSFPQINQAKPECGRQSLAELLIRPVQRLPSVALLLNGNLVMDLFFLI